MERAKLIEANKARFQEAISTIAGSKAREFVETIAFFKIDLKNQTVLYLTMRNSETIVLLHEIFRDGILTRMKNHLEETIKIDKKLTAVEKLKLQNVYKTFLTASMLEDFMKELVSMNDELTEDKLIALVGVSPSSAKDLALYYLFGFFAKINRIKAMLNETYEKEYNKKD